MKRLCYASLLKVMYNCKAYNVSQKYLNGTMLLSIDSLYDLTGDDHAASTMSTGGRNIPPDVAAKSRNVPVSGIVEYFRDKVIPKLDGAKIKIAVLALIDILAEDAFIPRDTVVYLEGNKTKDEIINENKFDPAELIANLFLYAVINVKSSEFKDQIKEVTTEYLKSIELKQHRISLGKTVAESVSLVLSQTDNNSIQASQVEKLILNNSIGKKKFSNMINEDFYDFFVETGMYKQVTTSLEEKDVVILIGQPGVGKTLTSKKVANDYELRGFKILYSEEGNIANAKNVLNEINPQDKTLIILNDFLGQFYTGLKFDEKSEISGLVASMKQHKNIKLLINTRGIIYKEAMQCEKINNAIENNTNFINEIQIEELNFDEKALILLNHLKRSYKNGFLSSEHYLAILKDRMYGKIICHKNFNPRIIEHVTREKFLAETKPTEYVNQMLNALENPASIWQREYEKLDELDRICLNTLFSLTNTNVPIAVLKECFDARQKNLGKDSTLNHFEKSVSRLTDSLVSVIFCNGEQRIGIINPSLNDFLFKYLIRNQPEMDKILENSLYYEQIDKLMFCKTKKIKLIEQINLGLFDRLNTFPKQIFSDFEFYFLSPRYLHILKILLIYLDERELARCGIEKEDIQNFIKIIFKNQFMCIKADASVYFTNQLLDIFVKLLKGNNSYDLTEIMYTERYFNVILNSITRHDEFWKLLEGIQKRYFSSINKEEFYKNIESCLIEKITSEVIAEIYDDILYRISSEIEDDCDELENDDECEVLTGDVFDNIENEIRELISDSICTKLDEHSINSISEGDFDIDEIIHNEINVNEMIENKYYELTYSQSDDFKETVEKSVNNIIALFETSLDYFC